MSKWEQVDRTDPDGCWIWQGATDRYGYGIWWHGGKLVRVHRHAYFVANGPIQHGLLVCHGCDTRLCCNPAHLWLGTVADNNADTKRKGRTALGDRNGMRTHPERCCFIRNRGERHPHSKLTDVQRKEIVVACAAGETFVSISERYGISSTMARWVSLGTHSRARDRRQYPTTSASE